MHGLRGDWPFAANGWQRTRSARTATQLVWVEVLVDNNSFRQSCCALWVGETAGVVAHMSRAEHAKPGNPPATGIGGRGRRSRVSAATRAARGRFRSKFMRISANRGVDRCAAARARRPCHPGCAAAGARRPAPGTGVAERKPGECSADPGPQRALAVSMQAQEPDEVPCLRRTVKNAAPRTG